jgi:hypothetical protein
MYLRIKDSEIVYPYTIQQLKLDEYNVSFPAEITSEVLEEFGVYSVQQIPKPNDYTKNITEGTPQLIDGVYTQIWNETNATQEEIDIKIENQWEVVRVARNEILKECDWTVLPDSPLSGSIEEWKTYRQQLRDVTSQPNPFEISWPTQPS